MKLKIYLPILFLNLSTVPLLHQHSYAGEPYIQSQSTQIDKPFINEWVQYQTIVVTNQLEQLNLNNLAIELDRSPYDQRTAKLFKQMLLQPKNSIIRLEKLQLENTQLKELIQLSIQEYKFDLEDIERDFGVTEVEFDNDEYMSLFVQKQQNYIEFKSLREIVNNKVLSMILHNPLSSQNQIDTHENLVNDWFRYQNALNRIDKLHQQMESFSSLYLKEANEIAAQELKQKIDQYQDSTQKILEQVQPKSSQMTAQIKEMNISLQLTTEYLRNDYAMRGIDGLIESNDSEQPKNRSLGQDYFELIQKLKKYEYQIEKEVLTYLLNNPL